MLTKEFEYEDLNGAVRKEKHHFNLNQAELMTLSVSEEGGLETWVNRIIAAENAKEILALLRKVILLSYGEKSPDGRRFVKTPEMATAFEQSAPYEILFVQLATNPALAAEFVKGVIPAKQNPIPN